MKDLKIEFSIISRDDRSLNKYLIEIGKIPLLTMDEELSLTKKIRAGDQAALERLVESNLRFVVSVAKQYQNRGLTLGDLVNEGNLGLIKAGLKFDTTKGFKFISYAVWWIRQSILLAIAEQTRTIRLPLNLINTLGLMTKTRAQLEQQLERLPTAEELAEAIDVREEQVREFIRTTQRSVSLEEAISNDMSSRLLDLLPDDGPPPDLSFNQSSFAFEVRTLLKGLPKREQRVLQMFYGLSGTQKISLEEIAVLFQLSKERVRQIKDSGLKRIRLKLQENRNKRNK